MTNIKISIFYFYFFNKDFSVTTQVVELKFSVCALKFPLEGIESQNFDLGLSFYLRANNV